MEENSEINAYENPAFSREQYERDRESIARGINPYMPELNIGILENKEIANKVGIEKRRKPYMLYEDAERILRGFDWSEPFMRSVIAKYASPALADRLDYRGLLREAHKIRGIAKKILAEGKLNDIDELTWVTRAFLQM